MIYMDNAASTRLSGRALKAMTPFLTEFYANPAAGYGFSEISREAVAKAREQIAGCINANPKEIFFTSGGTESDNWALRGIAYTHQSKGKHLIVSAIEHHAVMNTARALEKDGWNLTILPVDEEGFVDPENLEAAIRPDTVLVSVMAANNEIGTIEPLAAIGEICHRHGVLFHTDAVQAFGHIPLDVQRLHIDLLSASAHKFHGPKGVGFLYIRKGVDIEPLLYGGDQERGQRSGTLNVPGIVGMGAAAEEAAGHLVSAARREATLRDYLADSILSEAKGARFTGARYNRLPGHASFVFDGIDGESLLQVLNARGICASAGSACSTDSEEPSYVLEAIGVPPRNLHSSLRLTISDVTTEAEIEAVIDAVKDGVACLRGAGK